MKLKHFLFAEADGNGADGGGSGGGDAGGGDAGAAAASATAQGGAGGGGDTAITSGGNQGPTFPEKYQVKNEAGQIDWQASALKQAEGYNALSKRAGEVGMPPKTPEEYTVAVPDALKGYDLEADDSYKEFRAEAHKAGLTQKQMDFVMGKYFQLAPALVNGAQALSKDECLADLKTTWKTEQEMRDGIAKAQRAYREYFGADAEKMMAKYGNDPALVRFMARLAEELGEDTPPSPNESAQGGVSINAIRESEAYKDPKHPDHERVSKQVQAYYEAQARRDQRQGRVAVM